VIFAHSQATVTFNHGPRPSRGSRSYLQDQPETTAGIRNVQDFRARKPVWALAWTNMPKADRVLLESFYIHVKGIADTWTWTWSDGTVKTVRFLTPELQFIEKTQDVFQINIDVVEI
jgi:hypothetical protein